MGTTGDEEGDVVGAMVTRLLVGLAVGSMLLHISSHMHSLVPNIAEQHSSRLS